MVASRVEGEAYFQINNERFNSDITKTISSILPLFDKIIKSYIRFYVAFCIVFAIEILLLLIFLPFVMKSSLFSFSLAGIFLTIFSFFILKIYFQAKKTEQEEEFLQSYSRGCQSLIGFREGIPEHHIALANAFSKLANELHGHEHYLIRCPKWLNSMQTSYERFSYWCFWKDIYSMRESLLEKSIDEHVTLVKCEPTSLDIHAALANAYVMLSGLYLNTIKPDQQETVKWSLTDEELQELEGKFRKTAKKAIEEFKILNDFAPNDPWVHTQLAYSFRDLKMPEEEIGEYELILNLRPDDIDTLYKLGCLYFQQERNAEGLKTYEKLKQVNFKKAEKLITFYGS
jgi:tetratricopeptide (TPR) repeat protein